MYNGTGEIPQSHNERVDFTLGLYSGQLHSENEWSSRPKVVPVIIGTVTLSLLRVFQGV